MKHYSNYKESGVPWLGMIPEHWEVRRLYNLIDLVKEKTSAPFNLPYVGMENIESWNGRFINSDIETEGTANIFKKDDILFGKLRPYLAKVFYATFDGCCSTELLVYRAKGYNAQYYSLLMLSKPFIDLVDASTYGTKMPRASHTFINKQYLPLPPLCEQRAIATYLEEKTTKIERHIAERKREIALLGTLRQAEIAQAVTRGLNPNAPLKESGIPWIGKIPEHWEVRRVKNIFIEKKDKSITGVELPLSLSREKGILPSSEKVNKTMESASFVGCKLVECGNIVFNRFKARLFAISHYDGVVSSDYAVYKCNENAEAEYMVLLFNTDIYREAFNRKASGIGDGFSRLYTQDLFAFYAVFPPLCEQRAIVSHIQEKLGKIDAHIAELEREIVLLCEYKVRLVSDAVTGQICVTE